MSVAIPTPRAPDLLRRAGMAAICAAPLLILATRAGADILIGMTDAMFLAWCAVQREWRWARRAWFALAVAWWGWTLAVSLPLPALGLGESGWRSFVQALVMGRFFVFAAAIGVWLSTEGAARQRLGWAVDAAAAFIAVECWQQLLTGTNIFGDPRWGDGALTGPFFAPRAGPVLIFLLYPALIPAVTALLRRPGWGPRLAAAAVTALGVATMLLIGQRMPAVLMVLGLAVCAVLVRQLRPAVLAAAVLGAGLLAATPVISPPTFAKLVLRFTSQLEHFTQSQYGLLYIRATVITLQNPLTGLGFDGFKDHCDEARYQMGLPALGIGDAAAAGPLGCSMHPHNHYFEAATAGGLPGLLLFSAMALAWCVTLGRGLWRDPAPRRVGLFVAILLAVWPLASTSAFFTLPNAGWMALLLGWGVALSKPAGPPPQPR